MEKLVLYVLIAKLMEMYGLQMISKNLVDVLDAIIYSGNMA